MIGKVLNNFTYFFMSINIQDFIKHPKELIEPHFAKILWLNKTIQTKSERLSVFVFRDDIDITFKINLVINNTAERTINDYLGEVHIPHQVITDEYQKSTQDIFSTLIKFKNQDGVVEQSKIDFINCSAIRILIDLNNPNPLWCGDNGEIVIEKIILSLLDENFAH